MGYRSSTRYYTNFFNLYDLTNSLSVVLAEIEACSFRNKSPAETEAHMKPLLEKYLPLNFNFNNSNSSNLQAERQKDHYSHFILRLAFSSTEDLRRRFSRVENSLFRLRFQDEKTKEREAFVSELGLEWEQVNEEEKMELGAELLAAAGGYLKKLEDESWFKVDWERVPELVESRRVFIKRGKAYVPVRDQMSMVLAEFSSRLDKALVVSQPSYFVKNFLGIGENFIIKS